ncbi:outer membrane lipoprotein chaperone LolA [Salinicola rhizosphaerae]|uniref:Outer-membrane lipoprotein carrier protein n=1 Tax=Salinicola rhizosphaerae TaxID=1443141 RepID=A0ABQ3EDQ3_9GAMM|nr:outer membrane lipoprotein chaperone LolA [Salinicola rhizosphaerae]GHB27644.1 outer-membrane lipoprotein carrier protein [Salinicola rhizosphaerae]
MRMMKRLATVGALMLAPWVTMTAQADQASVDRLTHLLEPLKTYSADFKQQILDASGSSLQDTSGHMWLSRPGHFRWEVNDPYRQLVVSDGDDVTLYDPDLQQVTIQPLDDRVTHTPALLLSGSASQLADNYDVTRQQQGATETFTLVPQANDTLFEQLKLTFYSEKLDALQMTDSTGQRTAIDFDNAETNVSIDPAQFQFDIPEGADVVREQAPAAP